MFHDLALRCVRPTTEPAQAEVVKYLQLAAPADLEPTMYPGMYPQIGVDVHSIRPERVGVTWAPLSPLDTDVHWGLPANDWSSLKVVKSLQATRVNIQHRLPLTSCI